MLKYFLSFIFLMFLITACNDETETNEEVTLNGTDKYAFDSTDLKTEELDEDEVKVFNLAYKFNEGENFKYRLTTFAENKQTIDADTLIEMNIDQKIVYLIDLNVVDKDESGVSEIKFNISSINLDAEANGQNYHFEAGVTKDSVEILKYAEYQALYNNPFFVRVNKKGELLEIFKADAISNSFLKIRGLADSVSTEEKNMLRNDLVETVLRPLVVQLIREFPEKEVGRDSTWTYNPKPVPLLTFQIFYTNKYKITDIEKFNDDKIAIIDGDLDTRIEGATKHSEQGVSYNFEQPKSTAEGKIFFNISKGVLQKSKTKTRVELVYTMEAQTPQGMQKGKKSEVVINRNILELI